MRIYTSQCVFLYSTTQKVEAMHVVGVSLCNVEGGREYTKLRTRRERKGKPSLNLVNVTTLLIHALHA